MNKYTQIDKVLLKTISVMPTTLVRMSRQLNTGRQYIDYHLQKLLEKKLIIKVKSIYYITLHGCEHLGVKEVDHENIDTNL
jgi:predicted transcriptional regulator